MSHAQHKPQPAASADAAMGQQQSLGAKCVDHLTSERKHALKHGEQPYGQWSVRRK